MCVKGKSLTQLSFTKVVIRFSTWQAQQKKTGKEYLCICCTVSRHMGRAGGTAGSVRPADMLYNISGKVDPNRVLMLHCCNTDSLGKLPESQCCNVPLWNGKGFFFFSSLFLISLWEKMCSYFCARREGGKEEEEACEGEGREKADRPG